MIRLSRVSRVLPSVGLAGLAFALVACGGSGGGGPTAPDLGAASIAGAVESGGSGSNSSNGAKAPISGVTVSVRGTAISTVTNSQGRFSLSGVPAGDRMLGFDHGGQSADVLIAGVEPGERIEIVVALDGSNAAIQSMNRGGGPGTGLATIDLEKATNGEDADLPPGPTIPVGDPVEWTYVATNTGDVELTAVTVSDDQGVAVSCPADVLRPGESMTCMGHGTAVAGQYANVGSVTALDDKGNPQNDSDPSHYFGGAVGPAIDLEKATNGEDADEAPGPTIPVGAPVEWTYVATNTGTEDLFGVAVSDDQGVIVTCPTDTLLVGESMTCMGSGFAVEGQYANLGTAVAGDVGGNPVQDEDPSHYLGVGGVDPFAVQIQPDHWNTNWIGSSGTVSAKIQGGDLAAIDPASILLFETDPALGILPVGTPDVTGNHVRARFPKSAAFEMLADPQTGETRTVTVRFVADGAIVDLTGEILIVGPAL